MKAGPKRIILFTRYPEPGKVKTRLIPALGPEGACDLHRKMTETALTQVRQLAASRSVTIEVCFEGGTTPSMQEWLGRDLSFTRQDPGDLGLRMSRAFQRAFQEGCTAAVLIGSDCPFRTKEILNEAFEALTNHDLILGPALDGGYYLIGLKESHPLFEQISWGSADVLTRTEKKAGDLKLKTFFLEPLRDIDRPEDLDFLASEKGAATGSGPDLSIIIPALNEAETIASTISRISKTQSIEIILVDGGSQDGTPDIATSLGVRVLTSPRGRAKQMNTGAGEAKSRTLLFLHADTLLPSEYQDHINQILSKVMVVAGAFQLKLEPTLRGLKTIEQLANWRARVLQLPYGDQALFLRSDLFRTLGGFKDIPIMEDVDLVRRLRREGRIEIAPVPAVTSSRRWKENGVWRTTLKNQLALGAFGAGISPDRLARWYHRKKPLTVEAVT